MPALGALLVLAGLTSLKLRDIRAVWHAGWPSRVAALGTFLAALFLSIQAAVGIGVLLSALLYVSRSSTDVSLVELVERPDGHIEERESRPSGCRRTPSRYSTSMGTYSTPAPEHWSGYYRHLKARTSPPWSCGCVG